ncbi:hypothetical protein PHJA_000173800 [Phtheirospermum japonicum]|uniref:Uncharacterized protein n=1 Tax=Phtheirospermum japonicum TaxID=374723 RepID=A0A830B6P5_9LAMI|nr:hypothetical protein PHJA_000173800 [Phtheirospermum japonicum]
MEKRVGGILAVVVVVAAAAANCSVQAQIYSCWGGCYNECFLRSNETRTDSFACYYECLNSCVPRTPADYQYYCQIGCNLEQCTQFTSDGAKLERCFGKCTNLCKKTLKP